MNETYYDEAKNSLSLALSSPRLHPCTIAAYPSCSTLDVLDESRIVVFQAFICVLLAKNRPRRKDLGLPWGYPTTLDVLCFPLSLPRCSQD